MSEEEASALMGLLAASPPCPPTTYGCDSPQPLESESYAPCDWPEPLVFKSESDSPPGDCYCPDSPYSPVPPDYQWPLPSPPWTSQYECAEDFLWSRRFGAPELPKYEAPPYIPSAPSYMPKPLGSECRAPPYSPQQLESECLAPPSKPTTTDGCHSPLPLKAETESFASSPSPPPYPLKIESESGSSPSPPPSCCAPTTTSNESECGAAAYAPTIETPLTTSPLKKYGEIGLFGQIGLHFYNLHMGTNLQFLDVALYRPSAMFCWRILIEAAEEPIGKSTCYLDIEIFYMNNREGDGEIVVTRCLLRPEVKRCCYERLVVDDFFKGAMPTWISEDALTGTCKRQYYELTKSEVEQDKGWLQLYALLAYLALRLEIFPEKADPFVELRKVVVQTKEDVEPKKKATATNAIFFISFRKSDGRDFNAIIRRTTVEIPGHMELEFKCFM